MKPNLRIKLMVSNTLPIFLLAPLLSLFLFYSLEELFSQTLLQQLTFQARLLLDQTERQPELIEDRLAAQRFLAEIARLSDARVLLLSKEGTVLASNRAEDASRLGQSYQDAAVAQALRGEPAQGIGPGFSTEVAYVVLPLQRNGDTIGALRVSYEVAYLRTAFSRLQWVILEGVILTVILGLGLSLGLATTIARPVRELTERVQDIARGNYQARVTARSGDEIGSLAQSFNQMAARLEEAEQTRARQLAAIAHELTRPLAGIRAAVETLHEDTDADIEIRDALFTGIEEEVARLERLVATLHSRQQQTLRPMQLDQTNISLERVIRASVANFEPIAAHLGVALSVEIPRHLPWVQADEDRLIQVLTNLMDNALKFTSRGGRVTVQAGEQTDALWVRVADTGTGIAFEELPYVFQQFYRGNESRPPEKQGMGLGLAICREIITAHGGQIWVESEPNQGTRFTFTLPKVVEVIQGPSLS
ncbi:MAG: HAMP domain-containing histidine kinase [Anaerolineae bacterium]|nr:HAMP domain-containing histidine kinase [Anaerolineae bacterium]